MTLEAALGFMPRSRGDPALRRLSSGGIGMTTVINGVIRGTSGVEMPLASDPNGNLFSAQAAAPYEELVRLNTLWSTMSTSAVAGLVVRPGTTAAFEIFNNYGSGTGTCLVIDRVFWFNLVSAQVTQAYVGWVGVTAPKAAPTNGNFVVNGASGKIRTAGAGPVIAAASTTIVDPGWFPWGFPVSPKPVEATVTPYGGTEARIEGRIIVPPQCSLVMHCVSQTTASTFTQGASWYERTFNTAPGYILQ